VSDPRLRIVEVVEELSRDSDSLAEHVVEIGCVPSLIAAHHDDYELPIVLWPGLGFESDIASQSPEAGRLAGPEITEYGEIGRGDKKVQFVEFLTGDAQAARHSLEQKVDSRCVDRNRGK
jgi:hypothetical protein